MASDFLANHSDMGWLLGECRAEGEDFGCSTFESVAPCSQCVTDTGLHRWPIKNDLVTRFASDEMAVAQRAVNPEFSRFIDEQDVFGFVGDALRHEASSPPGSPIGFLSRAIVNNSCVTAISLKFRVCFTSISHTGNECGKVHIDLHGFRTGSIGDVENPIATVLERGWLFGEKRPNIGTQLNTPRKPTPTCVSLQWLNLSCPTIGRSIRSQARKSLTLIDATTFISREAASLRAAGETFPQGGSPAPISGVCA